MTKRRALLLAGSALLVSAAVALATGLITVPPHYNPWAPLDIRAEPTFVTPLKLWRLEHDPALCRAALQTSEFRLEKVTDQPSAAGCSLADAVRITGSDPVFSSPFLASCPLAVSVALFEEHVLQPAAKRHFGQVVQRIAHLGSYACRNVSGREDGRRSEHATANAIDIAGFTLLDGWSISVQRDWAGDGAKAAFLRDMRDGACRVFDVVLSPEYNRAHQDHFHFDMGPFRACR